MLNDLSTFTRRSLLAQMAGPGFAAGGMVGVAVLPLDPDVDRDVLAILGIALVLIIGWAVGHVVALRRLERRLWDEVEAGSEELLARSPGGPLAARVVRGRAKHRPAFTLATGRSSGPTVALAATVVGDGAPRRVGLLAPAGAGLRPGAPLLVAVHPERREVAVLEDRVTADEVARGAADERWRGPLPSDRTVIGGWSPLVGLALLGLAGWAAVGLVVSRLLVV